jgi:hypothetical protein
MSSDIEHYRSALLPELVSYAKNRPSLATFVPVAKLLGCQFLLSRFPDYELRAQEQPSYQHESVVREALVLLTSRHDSTVEDGLFIGLSILDGLLRHERWRACLTTPERARGLTMLVAGVFDVKNRPDYEKSKAKRTFLQGMTDETQEMLNAWLAPAGPAEVFSERSFASKLFGEPWCCIVFDSLPKAMRFDLTIEATAPPFLPGLLDTTETYVALTLPSLD